jgi:hypothetical protein
MIKRIFWLVTGALLAALGLSYLKKKAAQNPEKFSTDALIEKFIEIFGVIKESVQSLWHGFAGGQSLNDHELEKIFADKPDFDSGFNSTIKPKDISLN